jgi:hypothetical protein
VIQVSWGNEQVSGFDELLSRVPKSALDSPRRRSFLCWTTGVIQSPDSTNSAPP